MKICVFLLVIATAFASGQRITTIQLDGVQYFVSRMNPYSPELNYFLAYQYCRSLGLQLASFETKEKADTMTQYLKNAGYTKYDFWTSGNHLGTDMFLWMSTGLPFNGTFNYMLRRSGNRAVDVPPGTEPQRVARESEDSGSADGCVAMIAPSLAWDAQDCTLVKDFICEQTRCYYYNYGSIPVSATQGNRRPYLTTTASPNNDDTTNEDNATNDEEEEKEKEKMEDEAKEDTREANEAKDSSSNDEMSHENENDVSDNDAKTIIITENDKTIEDPVVGRLITGGSTASMDMGVELSKSTVTNDEETLEKSDEEADHEDEHEKSDTDEHEIVRVEAEKSVRPDDIPDITSLFTDSGIAQKSRKETAFDGLETHEIRSSARSNIRGILEHRENTDDDNNDDDRDIIEKTDDKAEIDLSSVKIEQESHTIGPYDSIQEDYANDQPDDGQTGDSASSSLSSSGGLEISGIKKEQREQDEDTSTFLPDAEPEYRYNMKWRSMGKVLDPPSK